MATNDEFWSGSEIEEDVQPGKALERRPREPSEADVYRAPDRITPKWVRQQLPKTVWSELPKNAKINEFIIANMAEDAKRNLSKRAIMARAGFSTGTWDRWASRATQGEEPYALWLRCIMIGKSSLEEELWDSMYQQAVISKDFKATQYMLKHNNPEEYSEDSKTTVNIEKIENTQSINYTSTDKARQVGNILAQLGIVSDVVDADVVEDDEDE